MVQKDLSRKETGDSGEGENINTSALQLEYVFVFLRIGKKKHRVVLRSIRQASNPKLIYLT